MPHARKPSEVIDAEFWETYESNDTGYDGLRGPTIHATAREVKQPSNVIDPRALEGFSGKDALTWGGLLLIAYGVYKWAEGR